jgi:hypothetical protein
MTENLFNAEYDVTKKSKLRKFYDSKKILIYSFIFSIFVIFVVTSLYFENKEKKIFYYLIIIYKLKFIFKMVKMIKP